MLKSYNRWSWGTQMIGCSLLLKTRLDRNTMEKNYTDHKQQGHMSPCKQTPSQDWDYRLLQQNNYVLSSVQYRKKTSVRWKKRQNVVGGAKKIFEVSIKGTAECHV